MIIFYQFHFCVPRNTEDAKLAFSAFSRRLNKNDRPVQVELNTESVIIDNSGEGKAKAKKRTAYNKKIKKRAWELLTIFYCQLLRKMYAAEPFYLL